MNIWGENLKLSIFGESHGEGIGVVIDSVPSGTKLDLDEISRYMQRRAPGRNKMSTPRKESDEVQILSGFYNGVTTGTPLCAVIKNTNTQSKDYEPQLLRPGHADYTAVKKYGLCRDFRGGGHFSGRITAPLVFAGTVAKQILEKKGITIGTHIYSIGEASDTPFDMVNLKPDTLKKLSEKDFPVIDGACGEAMKSIIEEKRMERNSAGGIVECGVTGIEAGIGAPFFGSVESKISSMMFSIPAVKGIEFGLGFDFAKADGKEANDEFYIENGEIKTYTNNNAGINGGITNGMPVVFRVVFKPTPSIGIVQRTVDIDKMENAEIQTDGRHDPCIVHRGAVVVEAATAVAILDMIL